MTEEFTISAFSENHIGLLNRVTIIFTRRHINIESLTVSESAIPGLHKFTIVVNCSKDQVRKVVKQIEKLVEVTKAYYHSEDEVVYQEIALYKIPTSSLIESNELEKIIRKYNARILEVTTEYTVIEKSGHKADTTELFDRLTEFKVLQFTRSGRIIVTKDKKEQLTTYLESL